MDVSFYWRLWKYNTIRDKVSADIKKEFDSEPAYNKEKAKIKSNGDEVTDSYDKKIPKVESNHTCLALISLGSNFLSECKYTEKKVISIFLIILMIFLILLMSLIKNRWFLKNTKYFLAY